MDLKNTNKKRQKFRENSYDPYDNLKVQEGNATHDLKFAIIISKYDASFNLFLHFIPMNYYEHRAGSGVTVCFLTFPQQPLFK